MEDHSTGDVTTNANEPPAKKARSSLFASYKRTTSTVAVPTAPVHCTVQSYLELASSSPNATVKNILCNEQFKSLRHFVSSMYCVPATSAPVERIFSHGDIFMRLHRARMTVDVHQKCEHFGLGLGLESHGLGLGLGLESYGLGLVLVLPLLVLTTSPSSTNVEMDKRAISCNQFIAIHKMSAFANYIECTCIDGDFLPSLWTHYGNPGPRTTNPTEGWHNALNCTFSMRRPSLRTFLHYVQKCQFEVQTCIIQLKAAQPPKSKCENYIKLEQNLTAAKLDYGIAIAKTFSCIFPHPSAYTVRSLTMTLQAGDNMRICGFYNVYIKCECCCGSKIRILPTHTILSLTLLLLLTGTFV